MKRLFVVEDDEAHFRLLEFTLAESTLELDVVRFSNADEAVCGFERLKAENLPDLFLFDYRLQNRDASFLIAELKRLPLLVDVPIVVFSSSAAQADSDAAFAAGASSYFVKPMDLEEYQRKLLFIIEEYC